MSMTATIFVLGHEAAFVAYACFAALMLARGARTWLMGLFLAAAVATALWAQIGVAAAFGVSPLWLDTLMSAARDATWLGLCFGLMYPRGGKTPLWCGLVALAVVLVGLQGTLDISQSELGVVAGVHIDGAFARVAVTLIGLVALENILRNSSQSELWSLKHLLIGLLSLFAFQLLYRVPEFLTHKPDPDMLLARPLVFLLALPLFVVSSVRLPNINLRVHSSRTFVFHSATLIGTGIMLQGLAIAAWYVRKYGGSNGTVLAVTLLFGGAVAIAVALVSGSVRSRLRRFINENFFNLRYDYRVEWEKVIRALTQNPEQTGAERALRTLCDLLDSPGGAIWIYRSSWRQFLPAAKLGFASDFVPIPESDPRIEALQHSQAPYLPLTDARDGLSWQQQFETAWIVMPLRHQFSVVGLVLLLKSRAPRKLDWEDENLIRIVALQLGAFLVQEETAQSLADARQLEEFNKRFAFVVHDIKNTIGQLSLLVQNIAKFGHEQEFRDDMVATLANAVERLQELLKSLTTVGREKVPGARPPEVVDLIMFLGEFTKEKENLGQSVLLNSHYRSLDLELRDISKLRRVLEHVVSNAAEASGTGKSVEISVTETARSVDVNVTDQGAGMTEKFINEELFRPMRTTKDGGFGIGAYQARELMRELGGDIMVASKIGKGTTVTLSLPRPGEQGHHVA